MNDNIANNIKEILAQTGTVIIPELGRFTAQYKPSVIDNIQGQLDAPSFDLAFDPNVRINDGILADRISRTQRISTQEAQIQIDDFVKDAHQVIAQHEQFAIPEVGKIYQDTSGKLQFVSFNQNLNPDSFGLPRVSFQPISRTQSSKTSIQEPNSKQESIKTDLIVENKPIDASTVSTTRKDIYITSGVEEEPKIFGLERTAFWRTFITTSLILSVLTILGLTQLNKNNKSVADNKSVAIENNVTTGPPISDVTKNTGIDSSMLFTGNTPHTEKVAPAHSPPKVEEKKVAPAASIITPAKEVVAEEKKPVKENSATIIIGSFGNANNIAKLRKWITQHNYEVYEKPKGDLKIIGAVVHFDTKEELNKIVSLFKERYGYEIEVKK